MNSFNIGDIVYIKDWEIKAVVAESKNPDDEPDEYNNDEDGYIVEPLDDYVPFSHLRYQETKQHWTSFRNMTLIRKYISKPVLSDHFDKDLFEL